MSKLEALAVELETLNRPSLAELIANVRNDNFRRDILVRDLIKNKCKYFAVKLQAGYYDNPQTGNPS